MFQSALLFEILFLLSFVQDFKSFFPFKSSELTATSKFLLKILGRGQLSNLLKTLTTIISSANVFLTIV